MRLQTFGTRLYYQIFMLIINTFLVQKRLGHFYIWLVFTGIVKKIIQENELSVLSIKSSTNDDTTSEYICTEDDSLEEYIVADYLIDHHSEDHDDTDY